MVMDGRGGRGVFKAFGVGRKRVKNVIGGEENGGGRTGGGRKRGKDGSVGWGEGEGMVEVLVDGMASFTGLKCKLATTGFSRRRNGIEHQKFPQQQYS